jgi:cell division septal protein FtsQ
MFGSKKQKGKRTLREYDGQKIKPAKARGNAKKAKKTYFFSRFMFYFLMLIFWGTAAYLFFFSGYLSVSRIEIQGNELTSQADMQKIVSSKLDEKYFNFLEKNNLVLLNSRAIRNEILASYKIISRVSVKKYFPDGIKVSILERRPQLILDSGGKDWVIDEKGEIFDEAGENFSYLGKEDFPVVIDESKKSFSLGDLAIDEKYISFISDFRRKVGDETGIEFEKEIRVSGISSGNMRMKAKEGWMILLDENLGADKEKDMFEAVLDNKIEKEKRSDLEYVDLRIPNKVFYKFKDATPEESAGEAANNITQDNTNVAPIPPINTSKKDDAKKKK